MLGMKKVLWGSALLAAFMMAGAVTPAIAQESPDDDKPSGPDMHALSSRFNAVRVKKDYSYIHRPRGDKVVEQPDIDRLLFWTPDGKPDGYAQRRGDSVIYYDAGGRPTRVERIPPGVAD